MSPASQGGGLEVKRYIGSCLISGPALLPLPMLPVGAAGGGGGAFSRLAAHTQGAPLILAGRCGPRKPAQAQRAPRRQQQHQPEAEAPPPKPAAAAEAPSTASDESSGPADSCLPRIIKPRKRRKKDRKPPAAANAAPEASSIVTLRPYVPLCYDGRRRPPPEAAPAAPPPAAAPASRCQCRLCDPAGRIWDVRRPCYSASLTSPGDASPFASIPLFLSAPGDGGGDADDTDDGFFSDELPPAPAAALRRSWSSSSAASSDSAPALEVSTEIVTSPNGHRDIEIKFFSTSPPSAGRRLACDEEPWGSESGAAARSELWDSEDSVERYLGESLWAKIQRGEQ